MSDASDRNLLFAVLALQLEVIDHEQFARACNDWALDMTQPMPKVLRGRGWITADDHAEIERAVQRKLKKHGGDPKRSLAEAADSSVREVLRSIDEPNIQQSVDEMPPLVGHVLMTTFAPDALGLATTHYTLSKIHGEGGLGRVWLAKDTNLNRRVALKEVHLDKVRDPRYVRRFLREAQITGQLEHPNIVPVYQLAVRERGHQPFYTMRFVEGRPFHKAIAQFRKDQDGKPLDRAAFQQELLEPFLKVCDAIGYAHSRDVLHRDLKPENVVLGDYGEAIVLDWGLAKLVPEAGDPGATVAEDPIELSEDVQADKTQGRVGSPAYMAPEQVEMKDAAIGPRTDIYGLGAILYEILTGRPLGWGATLDEVFRNVATGHSPGPGRLIPRYPRLSKRSA